MAESTTRPRDLGVEAFLASVDHDRRRREAFELEAIDLDVLAELIRTSLEDLGRRWPVGPS